MTTLGIGRDLAEGMVSSLDERLARTGLSGATRNLILDQRLLTALTVGGRALMVVGALQSISDMVGGGHTGDTARELRGALTASGIILGFASWPAAFVVGTASAYGDLMLATDAEEISAVEDRAMRTHFGNDITEPYTSEQADWLVNRYEGVGGFFTSISDQVDYSMRWMNDPIRDSAQDFRAWRHEHGWW